MLIMIKRCLAFFIFIAATTFNLQASIQVSGTDILDGTGSRFIMRGINHPHTWYRGETAAFANIAATGANTLRVVLSNGTQWTRNDGNDVTNVINLCRQNQLICVLEVHDSTGYPESSAATPIAEAVAYWLSSDILPAIQGQEDYIIINIANEPFGNNVSEGTYVNDFISAIQTLRDGGLTHALMVDGANWGQDWQFFMRDNAPQIFAADSLSNIIFDVHMYEVFANRSTQQNYIDAFQQHNLALVIGEFGPTHNGQNVDEDSILELAQQHNIGYLGWSWSGNGGCCTLLDMVNGFNPQNLTSWGERIINGVNGIRSTSVISPIFGNNTGLPRAQPQSLTTPFETPLSITLSGSSPKGEIQTYQVLTQPVSGALTGNNQNWVYTPNNGFAGSDQFTFTVVDEMDQTSDPATVSILVEESVVIPPGGIECSVSENTWHSGYVANVTVTNTSTETINDWSIQLTLDGNDQVTSSWSTLLSGSTGVITATNAPWNGILAPNQSANFGFQGSHQGLTGRVPVSCL